jgi:hypothetical protein
MRGIVDGVRVFAAMTPLPLSFVAVQDAACRFALAWDDAVRFGGFYIWSYPAKRRRLAEARANLEIAIAQFNAERKVVR